MPNPNVNYYTSSTTYSVFPGETWGLQDLDSDGSSDGGLLPLEMTMYANDGYSVDASYFTIKGYEPTSIGPNGERIWEEGFDTIDANGNEVLNIQLGGDLTFDINKVEMYNVSDGVKVRAWLNSTYNIVGSSNLELNLDIDGDAQLIPIEPEQLENQFYITLKLKNGENSNSIIEANVDWYEGSIGDDNIPEWFIEAVNIDDNTARLVFTKNPYYTTPQQIFFNSFTGFIIKPKNSSYTVCKDNFFVETVDDYTVNALVPWSFYCQLSQCDDVNVDETKNVFINDSTGTGSSASASSIDITNNPVYYLAYTYGTYNNENYGDEGGTNGGHYVDRIKNLKLGIEDGDNIDYVNINSLFQNSDINTSNSTNAMLNSDIVIRNSFFLLHQNSIISFSEYDNIMQSVNSWTYGPSPVSSFLNPIDWVSNVVIISFGGATGAGTPWNYFPENNLQTGTNIPKNFIIEIDGSAMEIQTGSTPSGEINIILEEN